MYFQTSICKVLRQLSLKSTVKTQSSACCPVPDLLIAETISLRNLVLPLPLFPGGRLYSSYTYGRGEIQPPSWKQNWNSNSQPQGTKVNPKSCKREWRRSVSTTFTVMQFCGIRITYSFVRTRLWDADSTWNEFNSVNLLL